MKVDIGSLSYDYQWFDKKIDPDDWPPELEDSRLKIRPYPTSKGNWTFREAGVVLSGEEQLKVFMYCLGGWEKIDDADEKPLPFNDRIKKMIFDLAKADSKIGAISTYTMKKSRQFEKQKDDELKN